MANRLSSLEVNRRKVLIGSGSAFAAGILSRAASLDAFAQEEAATGRLFFTAYQGEAIAAIAEVMWPETEDSAGGREAGVMYYIDRAVAGVYSDFQGAYTAGLEWLDYASLTTYGAEFRQLDADAQLDVVTRGFDGDLSEISARDVSRTGTFLTVSSGAEATPEADDAATPAQVTPAASPVAEDAEAAVPDQFIDGVLVPGTSPSKVANLGAFLEIVRVHVMEGLFSDPVHGGNRDFAGWAAVGYPGPYVVFNEEQQQSFKPLNLPFQSIADL